MIAINRILFFMNHYRKHLQKKWKSLLLLFLFPIFILSLVCIIVLSLFSPTTKTSITMAIVDEDQTEETDLIVQFLELTLAQSELIDIIRLSEEEAQTKIDENEISAYIVLPEQFTSNLYNGDSVVIPIVGNSSRLVDSFIVKELVESLTRYIESAQANVLTVYQYAKKTNIEKEELKVLLFESFVDFTLYTLGKGTILKEEVITNIATASPTNYYTVSCWFASFTIWLIGFYLLLKQNETASIRIRYLLLGVTKWQSTISRIIVALCCSLAFAIVTFAVIVQVLNLELYLIDYIRLFLFSTLYGAVVLMGSALIDVWFTSAKLVLLLQVFFGMTVVVTSGAIIPSLYFPLFAQSVLPILFSYDSFSWIVDIALEERNYANYQLLLISTLSGCVILWASTVVKMRWLENE